MIYCQKCGTENPEESRFCRECGTQLRGVPEKPKVGKEKSAPEAKEPKEKKRGKKKWIGLGIGIIIIGFIIFQTISSTPSPTPTKLKIVSFDEEVDEELSDCLSLTVRDFGVTGNTVWARGSVNWIGRPNVYLGGLLPYIDLYVYHDPRKHLGGEIGVEVSLNSPTTQLWVSSEIAEWSSDRTDVPKMGGVKTDYPQTFDFSLSTTLKLEK